MVLTWIGIILALLVVALVVYEYGLWPRAARTALALERRRAGLREASVDVDGTHVAYLHGGRGDTLVLVHGFGADKYNFTRVAAHLTRHFHVVVPDLPGFGDSTRLDDAPYSFEAQTRRLHDVIAALGITRFHIGGNSMGGAISALYAAHYPEQLLSCWLLNPGGVEGCKDSEMAARYRASGESILVMRKRGDFSRVVALASRRAPFLPYSVKRLLEERGMADQVLHTRIFDELATSPGINAQMAGCHVPTLIVWGKEDRVLDVSGAELLHQAIPGSKLIVLDGIGHLPMLECPKRAARDFLAFTHKAA